jgi:hypothetical protein
MLVTGMVSAPAHGASAESFSSANNSVNAAFALVYNAQQNGGDVSALVAGINSAIDLIQNAKTENATNPNAAAADLANATSIAELVATNSILASSSGLAARRLLLYESFGMIVATFGVATLTYLRGDRVYRKLWLYVYRNHVVKKSDE